MIFAKDSLQNRVIIAVGSGISAFESSTVFLLPSAGRVEAEETRTFLDPPTKVLPTQAVAFGVLYQDRMLYQGAEECSCAIG